MKFAMLIYINEKDFAALPKGEQNRIHQECTAWHEGLVKSGQSVGATGLQPTARATTLRAKNGNVLITDGPFAETKEMLGGFEMLECENLDEAISVAQRFPALRAGATIEVRPVLPGNACKAEEN